MSPRVASRFARIEESATYAVLDLVRRLRAQGASIVDLGGGEPDFDTPAHVVDEGVGALRGGETHYAPSRGIPELLAAIAEKLAKDNGIDVEPGTGVVVTPSAKHALFAALVTILDPGDELLLPTPSWVSYAAMAALADARPVRVELSAADGFRISREVLERHVTERTKAIVVNTPNNPTGSVLTAAEAAVVAEFATAHDLFVVTDEIYEKIVYDGHRHVSIAALDGCAERTLTVNGFSKAYAMTGWRLGYVAGDPAVIGHVLKTVQHTVGCAATFAQRAAVTALAGPQDEVDAMAAEYAARRSLVVDGLNQLPGVRCSAPDGAFYAFADIRGTGLDSAGFTTWALTEAGVAVTPGSAFGPGGEGHVRLSFAASRETIEQALERMSAALSRRG